MRLVALMLLAACLPAPHSLVGARCSDSDPCPSELYCVFGACSETLPPPELLAAWDFETTLSPWTGRKPPVRSPDQKNDGGFSLKVLPSEMALPRAEAVVPKRIGLYCARVWALHGVGAGTLSVSLRTYDMSGALISASPAATLPPPATSTFREVKAETFFDGGDGEMRLAVESSSTGAADFFYVDDVSVLLSASTCP